MAGARGVGVLRRIAPFREFASTTSWEERKIPEYSAAEPARRPTDFAPHRVPPRPSDETVPPSRLRALTVKRTTETEQSVPDGSETVSVTV